MNYDKPTQSEMYVEAINDAVAGDIRIEISRQYIGNINAAQIREFQDDIATLYFLTAHTAERPGELIRVYNVPKADSVLRVNQLKECPLVRFVESPEPGLVRCVLDEA